MIVTCFCVPAVVGEDAAAAPVAAKAAKRQAAPAKAKAAAADAAAALDTAAAADARGGGAAPPAEDANPFPFPRTIIPCWADDAEAYEKEYTWHVPVYLPSAPRAALVKFSTDVVTYIIPRDEPADGEGAAQPPRRPLAAAGRERYPKHNAAAASTTTTSSSPQQPVGGPRGRGTPRWTAERSRQYAATAAAPANISTPTATNTISSSNQGGSKWPVLDPAAFNGHDCGWTIAAYRPAPHGRGRQAPAGRQRCRQH
jgi:hypothetical protein